MLDRVPVARRTHRRLDGIRGEVDERRAGEQLAGRALDLQFGGQRIERDDSCPKLRAHAVDDDRAVGIRVLQIGQVGAHGRMGVAVACLAFERQRRAAGRHDGVRAPCTRAQPAR